MALNVNREVTDSFYRYKMPRLVAKVEGKGNGIKTVIVNVVDIAKALNRPPMYATKYFGIELGAQVNHEVKTDRYIVNGAHDAGKLQELLDGFIKRFVLCNGCNLPETDLSIRKGRVMSKCKACGYSGAVDETHKLCTFILREPPPSSASGKKEKEKPDKNEKASNKDDGVKSSGKTDDKLAAPAQTQQTVDDDDWAGDEASLQAAQRARLAQLGRAVRVLALDEDADKSEQERANTFHAFLSDLLASRIAEANATANGAKPSGAQFSAEDEATIVSEADRLELREKALLILVEVLYGATGSDGAPIASIVVHTKRYCSLLRRIINGNTKAQSYLLGAFEMLLSQPTHAHELRLLPNVLMLLYEADVLDEELILEWNNRPRKFVSREQAAVVRRSAAPFIEWLEKAEEEGSGDEEEDDDEDEQPTNGTGGDKDRILPPSATAVTSKPEEPEEEINIDEI